MSRKPTVYVFVDASNLWEAQKTKGHLFDLEKLKKYLAAEYEASSIEVFYYTAYPAEGTRDYDLSGKHRFFTFLKKALRFHVRKKELKRIAVQGENGGAIEEKGNMDVEMTIDAVYHVNKYDIALLFSGDSDFLALVAHLKNQGKKVYVYSSRNNISEELRTGGDGYVDVLKIDADIWQKDQLRHRNQK